MDAVDNERSVTMDGMCVLVPKRLEVGRCDVSVMLDGQGVAAGVMEVTAVGTGALMLRITANGNGHAGVASRQYPCRTGEIQQVPLDLQERLRRFLGAYQAKCLADKVGCASSAIRRLAGPGMPGRAHKTFVDRLETALTEAGYARVSG